MRGIAVLVLACACSFEHGRLPGAPSDDARTDDARQIDAAPDAGDPPMLIAAYNIAGEAHTGVDFPGMWAADPGGICDGLPWTEAVNVTNTVDDALFQRYQYRTNGGAIACRVGSGLPVDRYEVTLLFGEMFVGPGCPATSSAQRIFDVLIEGMLVENNLNTLVVGGCCHADATTPGTPFKRVYTLEVDDGVVNITLDGESSYDAMISAIMLRRL